jgi:Antibiotic biosynthesis monooxygenase
LDANDTTVEVVHFTVRPGEEAEFIAKRDSVVAHVFPILAGFRSAELTKLGDGTWLDVVHWESLEAAEAAGAVFMSNEVAGDWASHIDEMRMMSHGQVMHRTPGVQSA